MASNANDDGLYAGYRPLSGRRGTRARHADVSIGLAALAAILTLGALSWWYRFGAEDPGTPMATSAPRAESPDTKPATAARSTDPPVKHPVEPSPPTSEMLPSLDRSDAVVARGLGSLARGAPVLSLLQLDGFVRRFVATVDNLDRAHAAPRLWPMSPAPQPFAVRSDDRQDVIDPNNDVRYAAFVALVERIDLARAVALYRRLYPLFQQAYVELGYPRGYFNDRLVDVIDHLLASPEPEPPIAVRQVDVHGPLSLTHPWLHIEFVDPSLEALTAGQKMMVRVGAVNERRLKARLAAVRAALVRPTTMR